MQYVIVMCFRTSQCVLSIQCSGRKCLCKSLSYIVQNRIKTCRMHCRALKTFSLNNSPSARISLRSATLIYISPLSTSIHALQYVQHKPRPSTTITMLEIIDDKSQHCIPFLLDRVKTHQERYASNPDQAPPLFLGLNGVQGAGKTVLVRAFPPQYLILC